MVIFTIVCCHGNSVQYTHMNENEIRGVWLIFIVNARSSRPKLKQIGSFLVLHPYLGVDTVNTVGSHLKIPCRVAGAKPGNSGCFPFDKKIPVWIWRNVQWWMEHHFAELLEKRTNVCGSLKFSDISCGKFSFDLIFLPEFSVEWFAFQEFNTEFLDFLENLPRKFGIICACFEFLWNFRLNGKRPL